MSIKICICAKTINYLIAGGHLCAYLNWALGFRSLGCEVMWLEPIDPTADINEINQKVKHLKKNLEEFNMEDSIYLCSWTDENLPNQVKNKLTADLASSCDLLLNLAYTLPENVVKLFSKSALVDIDPGLTQIWISEKQINIAKHDFYFTIGETVGEKSSKFPDCNLNWLYTPPPVYLEYWTKVKGKPDGNFTTITGWGGNWILYKNNTYNNSKRKGFEPYFELPKQANLPFEIAFDTNYYLEDIKMLRENGWSIANSASVASTPNKYKCYIQSSLGEFSCAKPCYVIFETSWISDRTLCYLASGKPAIVQFTGESGFLPSCSGIFRFKNPKEAIKYCEMALNDYEKHSKLARSLAEEYFDAKKILYKVLEQVI